MPNLPAGKVVISFRDGSDSTGYARLSVGGADIAAARSATAGLVELLRELTGCSIERWSISYGTTLTDEKPALGVPDTQRGIFVFSTGEPGQLAVLAVPGLRPELLEATGPGAGVQIDLAAPAVVAFADGLAGFWVNPFGYSIATLENAFLQVGT